MRKFASKSYRIHQRAAPTFAHIFIGKIAIILDVVPLDAQETLFVEVGRVGKHFSDVLIELVMLDDVVNEVSVRVGNDDDLKVISGQPFDEIGQTIDKRKRS